MPAPERLAALLGPGGRVTEARLLKAYAASGQVPEIGLLPASVADAASLLKAASEERFPVVLRGNGTKLRLGPGPDGPFAVVGTERLNRITDLDAENLTVACEAGVTLASVQEAVRPAGLKVPLDSPYAGTATIGGILASASDGPRRLLYGAPRDLTLGVRASLASGETVRLGGKTVKNVAGYNLTRLLVGSQGTLGLLVEATLRLRPVPEVERTLVMPLRSAAETDNILRRILQSDRWLPAALVLLNPCAAAEQGGPLAGFALDLEGPWQLVIAVEGFSEEVGQQVEELSSLGDVMDIGRAAEFWRILADGPSRDGVARAGVPIGQVPQFMARVEAAASSLGVQCPVVAQAGTGLVRLFPQWLLERPAPWLDLLAEARSAAGSLGGYLVLEEWPPQLREEWGKWGAAAGPVNEVMRPIKTTFDPQGILNPGRIFGNH